MVAGEVFSCAMVIFTSGLLPDIVERNPVRASTVARAEDYHWSSRRATGSGQGSPALRVTGAPANVSHGAVKEAGREA